MAESEKKPMSKARINATRRWNEKAYDRLELKVHKGEREKIKAHAESMGESLNQFLNRAVNNQIESDNAKKPE